MAPVKTLKDLLKTNQIDCSKLSQSILSLEIVLSESVCPLSFVPWLREIGISDLLSLDRELQSNYSDVHLFFDKKTNTYVINFVKD